MSEDESAQDEPSTGPATKEEMSDHEARKGRLNGRVNKVL